MYQLLRSGQIVNGRTSKEDCKIGQFLGSGGQGEVYKGIWAGRDVAVKWYFEHTATPEQFAAIDRLLAPGACPGDKFLWPLDLVEAPGVRGFGYIMRLREPRFKGLIDLITRRIDPKYTILVRAGSELTDGFRSLHLNGLCYRDISWGNAFLDPTTGEVLICDNDNVAPNKTPTTAVLGTPDYMAPELVRGETVPSRQTDLHSLAVLLFYMFCGCHPLVGRKVLEIRCWDAPARLKLFGLEPLFVFDDRDSSNSAVPLAQDPTGEAGANALETWPLFPSFFQEAFAQTFTSGLRDPDGRTGGNEWRRVMGKLRDSIYYCGCGAENFYGASGERGRRCWSCNGNTRPPMRLQIRDAVLMLNHDSQVYPHHLSNGGDMDYSNPLARVVPHPQQPSTWGLKNLSSSGWVIVIGTDPPKDVPPGRSVVLAPNTKIQFGAVSGEVLA